LDLEDCVLSGQHSNNLRCVRNLLYLRYIGLKDTKLDKIPVEIGKLQFLQILDLRGVDGSLPASVVRMRNLICLYLGRITSLTAGFGNLTSLQELDMFRFGEGVELEDLRYLTQLRRLTFFWPESFARDRLVTFVESLGKLAKLETLEIWLHDVELDVMQDWVSSPYLCNLMLQGWFHTLPAWINSSSLPMVSWLYINVRELTLEDINVLGTLPALRYLKLISTVGHGILSTDAFPCLRDCNFEDVILEPHVFTRGAMPMVQKLKVCLRVSDILSGDLDLSIWNLPSLEKVNIYLHGTESNSETFGEAEDVIMRMAEDHPKCSVRTWYGGR
jgi:Leucine-rich repeat (LRR) protein